MKVENRNDPLPGQVEMLLSPGPDGPIYMINLIKFKAKAEYADGRATNLSGREAYMLYAAGVTELITEFGGKIHFAADITGLALGVVEDLWDEVAIASYPNRAALVAMSISEQWKAIGVHREAGLAGQLNLESVAIAGAPNDLTD